MGVDLGIPVLRPRTVRTAIAPNGAPNRNRAISERRPRRDRYSISDLREVVSSYVRLIIRISNNLKVE